MGLYYINYNKKKKNHKIYFLFNKYCLIYTTISGTIKTK